MTIKKRVAISNIIMIVAPILIALAVMGTITVGVYIIAVVSNGVGFDKTSSFYKTAQISSEKMYEIFEHDQDSTTERLNAVSRVFNEDATYVDVLLNNEPFYSYGNKDIYSQQLVESVNNIDENSFISNSEYQLYHYVFTKENAGKTDRYDMYFFSNPNEKNSNQALYVLFISGAVLTTIVVIFAVAFTDWFLTRFVLRKIEDPLRMLVVGVNEINKGNLDYRIEYTSNDEFLPVCNAYNDMAEVLKNSMELIHKNEENRKELLLDISHDLRSPLTSIQAYVEGILDGVASTPEKQRRYLETIHRKTIEIEKMVSSVFAWSKLDLEETEVAIHHIDVCAYISKVIGAVADEYRENGLEIISFSDDNIIAGFDEDLLVRIANNIFDNSLKYKKDDTGHVYVSVCEEGKDVTIEFADDGKGVEPENLPKLFDVFYRTDAARTKPGSGNGIGLAFVQKAADAMNGSAVAKLNDMGGLSIIITLEK